MLGEAPGIAGKVRADTVDHEDLQRSHRPRRAVALRLPFEQAGQAFGDAGAAR